MFNPGSLVGKNIDQFRLDEFIGQGAMGIVFKAFDNILHRTVALKLISKQAEFSTPAMIEARKRLIQEAQAAGRLSHPNIVTIHSYGETEEYQYICMEYITGRTLAEVLYEQKVLAVEDAVDIFEQILMALDAANKEQIVHRDIKPTNIMIMDDKRAKVMDFGIAKIPSLSITTTGTVLGTPYYMSPEQISGQKVDIRSDIFSVGAVLYQVLTGERPFEGESTVTLAYKIVQVEPIPPKILNVHIPQNIEGICKKALTKDPGLRYQTPAEMLQDLRIAMHKGAPVQPAAVDTTIKFKAVAAPEKIIEERRKGPAPVAPEEEKPQSSPPPKKESPAPKPSPAKPTPETAAKGTAFKTFSITAILLLVMIVGVVFVVRLVKKTPPVPETPPGAIQSPAGGQTSGTVVDQQAQGKAAGLVQQAKNEWSTNPAQAQKLLEQAVALEPNYFEANYQLARILTFNQNYPGAIRQYQKAYQINNQVPEIPFNLGYILMNQGDYDQAVKYYELCRALSPPFQDEVLTNLGILQLKKNNLNQAQAFFKQALGLNPNNSLARSYLQTQQPPTAAQGSGTGEPQAKAPDTRNKAKVDSLVGQAKNEIKTNPANAQKLLEQAIGLDPNHFEAHYQLARAFTFKQDFSSALQHYQKAYQINNRMAEVPFNMGYIYMSQGNYDMAIKYYELCRTLSPPYQDEVLTNLGIGYLKKNNTGQAQIYFREALKINPNNTLAQSYLKSLGG